MAAAFVLYLIARLITRRNSVLAILSASAFALAGGLSLALWRPLTAFSGNMLAFFEQTIAADVLYLRAEPVANLLAAIGLGLGFLVSIYSGRYLALDRRYETYYPLLLLLVAGLLGMVYATDLFTLYLFCELLNIACYVLVGFRRRTDTAIEASLKYLIMGSVGTVTFFMGIAIAYGATGNLLLDRFAAYGESGWKNLALALCFVGLGIKSAFVPLHTWVPDAQGRAPSSISAILSGIVEQANLYALIKVVLSLGMSHVSFGTALIIVSLGNMIVGNLLALVQQNGKRLLAYSTIAHMGYLLLALGIGFRHDLVEGLQVALFVIWAHALGKALAFLCKGICHFYEDATLISELRGTIQRIPLVATLFALALASLASIPPLAGFVAKWGILTTVLQARDNLALLGLVIMLVTSVLALAYYLPMIVTLFSSMPKPPRRVRVSYWMIVPLLSLAILLLATSALPNRFLAQFAQGGLFLKQLGRG